jgi:hypothetical protein
MVDEKKKPPETDFTKEFDQWAEGRTGLTLDELIEMFSRQRGLTPDQKRKLREAEKKKEAEREKERKAKEKEEADRKKKEKEEEEKTKKAKEKEEADKKKKGVAESLIISRTPYPKWWKDSRTWNINIVDAGTWPVISKTPGYRTYIATLVFTVSGETNIALQFGVFPPTGPMDFGGDGEPMGMVVAMGDSPAPCGDGGFIISSDGAGVLVSGFVVYYYEKE